MFNREWAIKQINSNNTMYGIMHVETRIPMPPLHASHALHDVSTISKKCRGS